jgi:hypothetical protein
MSVPGDRRWLAAHGIDPEVWRERGVWRYDVTDRERVKDAFRDHLPAGQLRTVSKVVGQAPGLVLSKHAPPGFAPVIPQLRPDEAVVVNTRGRWRCSMQEWRSRPDPGGRLRARRCRYNSWRFWKPGSLHSSLSRDGGNAA